MAHFILLWNPYTSNMDDEEYQSYVIGWEDGDVIGFGWSVGSRRQGIGPGDSAYLYRVADDQGIVAAGTFTSTIHQDDSWHGDGGAANYADVEWDLMFDVTDRLSVDELMTEVPSINWKSLRQSGRRIKPEDEAAFLGAWEAFLERTFDDDDFDETDVGDEHDEGDVVSVPADFFDDFDEGDGLMPLADEVPIDGEYSEGAVSATLVNRYERDPRARAESISIHGCACTICGFNFEAAYGSEIGAGFIHVHHVRELSTLGPDYAVDPATDLIPVCPNCHAMLHRRRPAFAPDELRDRLVDR